MKFKREKSRNLFLHDTMVENIFIMEYMSAADGNTIKVYLTGLAGADDPDMSNELIARHLRLPEEEVLRAWTYWERCGAIRKIYTDPADHFHYNVKFLSLKDRLYGKGNQDDGNTVVDEAPMPEEMDDKLLKQVFDSIQEITGRLLESKEQYKVISWIYEENISHDLILYAYKYCVEKRGKNGFSYVSAVLNGWIDAGIDTVQAVQNHLAENDEQYNRYKRVMKAMGFYRSATEDEQQKIDRWFEEFGFNMDKVLDACAKTSGISNPNINYVNSILTSWAEGDDGRSKRSPSQRNMQGNSIAQVRKLYDDIRRNHVAELESHRQEIYEKMPQIRELESEKRKAMQSMSRLILSGDRNSAADIRQTIDALNQRQAAVLNDLGYPSDYLEMKYDCDICKDTGILDNGDRCECFKEKLKQFL